MQNIELPKTVRDALGSQAAHDLEQWIDQRFAHTDSLPISALVARQKANVLVLERVSNLLLADEPTLFREAGKWIWRVPIDLTFPSRGRVGHIGELRVDAQNGQVYYDNVTLLELERNAERLTQQVLGKDK